ncbi:U32 family peptidase [Candidatus Gracilibacteria bacterium]|nr:U32 family peptidase [Candidatus Gracilibacteria bacterium]
MKNIELLAPVGSFAALHSAIDAGADAIYFGVTHLNMRQGAVKGFTFTDLKEISKTCQKNKIRSYITLNTIIYDGEKELMKKIVDEAKKNKIDAIIASDLSVLSYCREIGQEVHCSTQLSISNLEAIKVFAQFVDRMVLARELDLGQIKRIVKEIKKQNIRGPKGNLIEIEVFVHGAMCISVSGRCFMSAFENGCSANRGMCRQMCRRAYKVTDTETGSEFKVEDQYVMSPEDLCAIEFLDQVIDTGVSCLKIEGRGRSPEYVSTVIGAYRKAIEAIEKGKYNKKLITELLNDLKSVYNRGFSRGFFFGKPVGAWSASYGSKATTRKIHVGKVTHFFSRKSITEVLIQSGELHLGDEIYIIGNTSGTVKQKIVELRDIGGNPVKEANKEMTVTFTVDKKVRVNDEVFVIEKVSADESTNKKNKRLKDRIQN